MGMGATLLLMQAMDEAIYWRPVRERGVSDHPRIIIATDIGW